MARGRKTNPEHRRAVADAVRQVKADARAGRCHNAEVKASYIFATRVLPWKSEKRLRSLISHCHVESKVSQGYY